MTPEQLEEIQGIVPDSVERIQAAINAYYAQFEEPQGEAAQDQVPPPAESELAQSPELREETAYEAELPVVHSANPAALEAEGARDLPEDVAELADTEEESSAEPALDGESGTMEDAGPPTQSESVEEGEHRGE
jgi:hypothetical protein